MAFESMLAAQTLDAETVCNPRLFTEASVHALQHRSPTNGVYGTAVLSV